MSFNGKIFINRLIKFEIANIKGGNLLLLLLLLYDRRGFVFLLFFFVFFWERQKRGRILVMVDERIW